MKSVLVFLKIVATIAVVSTTDYCSRQICSNGGHIACHHNGQFDKSCPKDAEMVPISNVLKNLLVDIHNEKRNFIAGGGDAQHSHACRMATMQWDDELAAIAALNVKQCKLAHDRCRNTDLFSYAGQNGAFISFYGKSDHNNNLLEVVEMWYSEVKNSKQSYIDSYPNVYTGPSFGHFTVMMADRNIRLGCAASTYSLGGDSYKAFLAVCNYATTNMVKFPIYAKCDMAGVSCKTGTNPQYPNLCSTSEEYDVNKWF